MITITTSLIQKGKHPLNENVTILLFDLHILYDVINVPAVGLINLLHDFLHDLFDVWH